VLVAIVYNLKVRTNEKTLSIILLTIFVYLLLYSEEVYRDIKINDLLDNFIPNYEISIDKKKIVSELKKLAKNAEMVWLASDEDREGEAISWHLFNALKLDESKTKRIVFHEITKTAITEAIENPRNIDIDLVNAQQARRVLDRLVGFELSPLLWRK